MKFFEVAQKLGCRLEGDGDIAIHGVAPIEQAETGQLTFLTNKRYFPFAKTTRASAILVDEKFELERPSDQPPIALLRTSNPHLAYAQAVELFHHAPQYAPGIHPTAVVAKTARIGAGVHIGPYCFVDDEVEIGAHAVLHSFVTLYRGVKIGDNFFAHAHAVVRESCRIGNRVILQNGVIIGADGFGFAKRNDGTWHKILQSGIVVLEDDVEVQANSCVDRATIGETRIGRGTKLDDLVLVGHACEIGQNTMLCGQVGLAGSTTIGDNCLFAGQSASSGHLTVGDDSVVFGQSGLPGDLPPGSSVGGSPAVDSRLWMKIIAALNRLPDLQKRLRDLEKKS